MNRVVVIFLICLLITGCNSGGGDTIVSAPSDILVNKCETIWDNMTVTRYEFSAGSVIDHEKGIYMFDCSGFVSEIILKEALPDHYRDLYNQIKPIMDTSGIRYMNLRRPLAATYYDYFDSVLGDSSEAENKYWKVFTNIDSIKKGDLILARYADSWRISEKNSTTGHVMIAWEVGDKGENSVILRVLDAASSAHTVSSDTRTTSEKPVAMERNGKKSGIGFGWMEFAVSSSENNRPYGYKWSLDSEKWYDSALRYNPDNRERASYDRLQGILMARPI